MSFQHDNMSNDNQMNHRTDEMIQSNDYRLHAPIANTHHSMDYNILGTYSIAQPQHESMGPYSSGNPPFYVDYNSLNYNYSNFIPPQPHQMILRSTVQSGQQSQQDQQRCESQNLYHSTYPNYWSHSQQPTLKSSNFSPPLPPPPPPHLPPLPLSLEAQPPPPPPPPIPLSLPIPSKPHDQMIIPTNNKRQSKHNNKNLRSKSLGHQVQHPPAPIKNAMAELSSLSWCKKESSLLSSSKKPKRKKRIKKNGKTTIKDECKEEKDVITTSIEPKNTSLTSFDSDNNVTSTDNVYKALQQPIGKLKGKVLEATDEIIHKDCSIESIPLSASFEIQPFSNNLNHGEEEMDISDDENCNTTFDNDTQSVLSDSNCSKVNVSISNDIVSKANTSLVARNLAEKKLKLAMALKKVALQKARVKLLNAQKKREDSFKSQSSYCDGDINIQKQDDINAFQIKSLLIKVVKSSVCNPEPTSSVKNFDELLSTSTPNHDADMKEEKPTIRKAESLRLNLELAKRKLKLRELLNAKAKKVKCNSDQSSVSNEDISSTPLDNNIQNVENISCDYLLPFQNTQEVHYPNQASEITERNNIAAELRKKHVALKESIEQSKEANKGLRDDKEIKALKQMIEKQRQLLQSHGLKISSCNQLLEECGNEILVNKNLKMKSSEKVQELVKRKSTMEKMITSVSKKIIESRRRRSRMEKYTLKEYSGGKQS